MPFPITKSSMKFNSTFLTAIVGLTTIFCALPCEAQRGQRPPPQMVVAADHTNGVYQVGDTVHWSIQWLGNATNIPASIHYTLKKGELTDAGQGDLAFTNGRAMLDTKFETPGQLFLEVLNANGGGRGARTLGGAIASLEQIRLSAPRPPDFDAFWAAKVKDLEAIPENTQLESADSGKTNVSYWKIRVDNIHGSHIYGQIARPAQGEKFPALLVVQWAGVYPLQPTWVTERAAQGWLVLNIEPHDMPIDSTDPAGAFANYWNKGNDDRDNSYFLRMYLSCYRAAQYLTERPDWNGQTLVVTGDSQGGQQTLMTAGFFPGITAALALVPAGCDMLGPDAGRRGGWPQWYDNTQGKDAQKVHEASRYFDVANFASRIKCPVLVGFGLIDETCPPEGVVAAFNQIAAPKEMVVLPKSPHQDVNGSQAPYRQRRDEVWLPALRDGKPAPVNVGL
jgi:cephalosporin-C deacetylase